MHLVEVDGTSHRVTRDEGGVMRSPAPALVVAVPVEVGAVVEAGTPVLVLESMKMETVLVAPFAARVRELMVATGGQVETGMPLVRLEPLSDEEQGAAAAGAAEATPLELPEQPGAPAPRHARGPPARGPAQHAPRLRRCAAGDRGGPWPSTSGCAPICPAGDPALLRTELDVVRVFADLCELTRNKPAAEETSDERVHSPREYFHSYLHSLDVDREHLPDAFRERLARVLSHYDVTDLDRTPALEEAVFRIFLAQQRSSADLIVVTALLQQWMDGPAAARRPRPRRPTRCSTGWWSPPSCAIPVVGDLARSARFRWFDQPVVEAARARRAGRRARRGRLPRGHPGCRPTPPSG